MINVDSELPSSDKKSKHRKRSVSKRNQKVLSFDDKVLSIVDVDEVYTKEQVSKGPSSGKERSVMEVPNNMIIFNPSTVHGARRAKVKLIKT
jgi:hypothetical protein